MKEIKVEDYVRIIQARRSMIAKVYKIEKGKTSLINKKFYCMIKGEEEWFTKHDIVKHNPNLTKVLETGDIIEHKIYQEIFKSEIYITNNDEIFTTDGERILPEEIISIETHEMFNQVKYEV